MIAGCSHRGSEESRRAATAIPGRASANTELARGLEKSNVAQYPPSPDSVRRPYWRIGSCRLFVESTVRAALDVDVLPGVPENQGVRRHRTVLDEALHSR